MQFVCRPEVVDDPDGKAVILAAELADLQPEGQHAAVAVDTGPYARMLPSIRGVRLTVRRMDAKFKYDDDKPVEHREHVAGLLEQRRRHTDVAASSQQRRHPIELGDWQTRRGDR